MKKYMFPFLILALGLFLSTQSATAQKYGHLNAGNLLVQLPEVAQADTLLKLYQDSLLVAGEAKAKMLESKFMDFMKRRNAGELTPKQEQAEATQLQTEEQELQNLEQEVRQNIQLKRQELMAPILKKVDEAVRAVAKEAGYSMIFDTSVPNTVLFVEDADDVLPMVLKKMGLPASQE